MIFDLRRWAGYALYTLVLFVIFLITTFPLELPARAYTEAIATQTGWRLNFDDVTIVPWDGARVSNLRVRGAETTSPNWLRASTLSLRPTMATLFGGDRPEASFHGEAYDGSFEGDFLDGGPVALTWEKFNLARYKPLQQFIEGAWGGKFSGTIEMATLGDAAQGKGSMSLQNLSIREGNYRGFTVPDLGFASGECEFDFKAKRLDIRTLKLSGYEVDLDLRGAVYIREPIGKSVVNATLTATAVPDAPEAIGSLLQLMKKGQASPNGSYSFRIYGILENLKMS